MGLVGLLQARDERPQFVPADFRGVSIFCAEQHCRPIAFKLEKIFRKVQRCIREERSTGHGVRVFKRTPALLADDTTIIPNRRPKVAPLLDGPTVKITWVRQVLVRPLACEGGELHPFTRGDTFGGRCPEWGVVSHADSPLTGSVISPEANGAKPKTVRALPRDEAFRVIAIN